MGLWRGILPLVLLVGLLTAAERAPHLAYAYPAGAARGTTVTLTVGGQFIDGAEAVLVSGAGVTGELLPEPPDTEKSLEKKRKLAKLAYGAERRILLTVAADAPPGNRSLALVTAQGLTNLLVFQVDTLTQVVEPQEKERRDGDNAGGIARRRSPVTEPLALPACLNGRILPGDADTWIFRATRDTDLVVDVAVRRLIPFIADAVPGWFQAVVSLCDASGSEVAYADANAFDQDPLLRYRIPADGVYHLTIHDSIWRGREDFVYRIAIGALPHIDRIFPLGGRASGKNLILEVDGVNLPRHTVTADVRPGIANVRPLLLLDQGIPANPVAYAVDVLPEILEAPAGDGSQMLRPPVIVNGRLAAPDEVDRFTFTGSQGQQLHLAVQARSLGSPLDGFLVLRGPDGTVVACADDDQNPTWPWFGTTTHRADPELTCTLPAEGLYTVELRDCCDRGGPAFAYRLHLSIPRPDFTLCISPPGLLLRPGSSVAVTLTAMRRNGFVGPIDLDFAGQPPTGLRWDGARIPAGCNQVMATLTAGPETRPGCGSPALVGRSAVDGVPLVHPAHFVEDQMQAFLWRHLVPCLPILAIRKDAASITAVPQLPPGGVMHLRPGDSAELALIVVRSGAFDGRARIVGLDLPDGITLQGNIIKAGQKRAQVTITVDATVPVDLQTNLILQIGYQLPPSADAKPPPGKEDAKPRGQRFLTPLPAVPIRVVAVTP